MNREEFLIRRFVDSGDEAAFEELVRERLESLRRIVAAAGPRNTADREDILQEVLIRMHRALGSYRFESSFTTWLFRITRNTTLDLERKRKRSRERELRSFQETISGISNPEELALESLRTAELKRLFYELDEADRQLLVLREREGLSMVEIATILGIRPGTVKSRLSRARRRAREKYEKLEEAEQ